MKHIRTFESVNESIDRATTVFQVATPAPQGILVKELEKLLPNKTIVTEVGDADGYESVLLFDLSGKDLKLIRDNIGDVLVWKYPIGKSKDVITGPNESVNEGSTADWWNGLSKDDRSTIAKSALGNAKRGGDYWEDFSKKEQKLLMKHYV